MNKIISIALFASFLFLGIIACKKNNLVVDKSVRPPAYAKFNVRIDADTAATYYIKSDNTPFKIPIGVTTVSDKDRTIQLCYTSSTATAGAQYNGPATIVIPAGKSIDTLVIQGLFAGYASASRIDIVYITICGGDVPASAYWATYKLTMRKYCDVILPDLSGDYTANEYLSNGGFSYGPYASGVTNLVSTGPTSASGEFINLYDFGWNNIHFTMDWSDPKNFIINIPMQATGISDPGYVRSHAGLTNTFSSCDQTFSISTDLFDDTQALEYAGYQFRLTR